MLLSVITPDNQPGMNGMLQRELKGIDAEIIHKKWGEGLQEATGDFICLLEEDSAIQEGTIRDNLHVFIDKPAYRKLAMVSPMSDLPSHKNNTSLTYDGGLLIREGFASQNTHSARVGSVPGAIIRASSLKRSGVPLDTHPVFISCMLSLFFWENGLRLALNPQSLYYAPENVSYAYPAPPYALPLMPTDKVKEMWRHEMIS